MPVPTSINDLSTTAASNSPSGSDSPATLDDHIRALASFIATLRDGAYTGSDAVKLTGSQTVAGTKTFSSPIVGSISGDAGGNAATATKLQTARTIGGVSFDGSANINLPGVNQAGNQNTTGNAATATQLSTASGSAPSYAARAWVNFNGTGTPAIRSSGNVSSITDYGTGDFGINFTTAMPDNSYCVISTVGSTPSGDARISGPYQGQTTSQARVSVRTDANVSTDPDWAGVAIFR